jgi:hypothetical protein
LGVFVSSLSMDEKETTFCSLYRAMAPMAPMPPVRFEQLPFEMIFLLTTEAAACYR